MNIHTLIENHYNDQVQTLSHSLKFQQLESGQLSLSEMNQFIANLCRAHLISPQILSFLYSIAPPNTADTIQHNLLEELGLDAEGICHPDLLHRLMVSAGFDAQQRTAIVVAAQDQLRSRCVTPLMFGTLKELGLSVLLEVTCFEWMLSKLSSRMGQALQTHRGLSPEPLAWFYHHSEVDVRHAVEGVNSVVEYVSYYDIAADELETLLDITFRENIFIRRYFETLTLSPTNSPVEVAG